MIQPAEPKTLSGTDVEALCADYARVQQTAARLRNELKLCDQQADRIAAELKTHYDACSADAAQPCITPHAEFGYRVGGHTVAVRAGLTEAQCLSLLRHLGAAYVRVREEIDRRRLLADRQKPDVQKLLHQAGLEIRHERRFYVKA
jgi:hypothetical protein